jgi:hypothetical protein
MTIIGHVIRANRFRIILDYTFLSQSKSYNSLAAGYIANTFLPVRFGEIVRALVLSGFNKKNFIDAFSSIIIERALDGVFIASFSCFLFFYVTGVSQELKSIFIPYSIIVFLFVILLILVVSRPNKLKLQVFKIISKLPKVLSLDIFRFIFNLVHIIKKLLDLRIFYKVVLRTIVMWVSYFLAYIFLAKSLDIGVAEGFSQMLIELFTFEIIGEVGNQLFSGNVLTLYLVIPPLILVVLGVFFYCRQAKYMIRTASTSSFNDLNFANEEVEYEFYGSYFKSRNRDFYINYKDIFQKCEIIKDKSGASGAVTSIIRSPDGEFFRKYEFGLNAPKLAMQLDFLKNSNNKEFVKIVKFKKSSAFVYYDMEYSKDCIPMFQAAAKMHDDECFDLLDRILDLIVAQGIHRHNSEKVIDSYIADKIKKNLGLMLNDSRDLGIDTKLPMTINGLEFPSVESSIKNFLQIDFKAIFKSDLGLFYHGDLTLENIIWNPRAEQRFYLIDPNFSLSFSSFETEVAKIYQSLEFDFENLEKSELVDLALNSFNFRVPRGSKYSEMEKYLSDKLVEYPYESSLVSIKIHALIHLLRTLPYAKNSRIPKSILVLQVFLGLNRCALAN